MFEFKVFPISPFSEFSYLSWALHHLTNYGYCWHIVEYTLPGIQFLSTFSARSWYTDDIWVFQRHAQNRDPKKSWYRLSYWFSFFRVDCSLTISCKYNKHLTVCLCQFYSALPSCMFIDHLLLGVGDFNNTGLWETAETKNYDENAWAWRWAVLVDLLRILSLYIFNLHAICRSFWLSSRYY